jgi:peptide-methionine (S)-S-oxide reductase
LELVSDFEIRISCFKHRWLAGAWLAALLLTGIEAMCQAEARPPEAAQGPSSPTAGPEPEKLDSATFGAGCFWCTEAVFQRLKGVRSVECGYSGGHVKNPTYERVCSGKTGHAEVVQITFDPRRVSYAELLEVFWKTHDPTTPNRQGPDHGRQYRSVIFYHSEEQRQAAEHYKRQLDASGAFSAPIVTQIVPFREFFPAEDYHQHYFDLNPHKPYCTVYIRPKVDKLEHAFRDKLKQ